MDLAAVGGPIFFLALSAAVAGKVQGIVVVVKGLLTERTGHHPGEAAGTPDADVEADFILEVHLGEVWFAGVDAVERFGDVGAGKWYRRDSPLLGSSAQVLAMGRKWPGRIRTRRSDGKGLSWTVSLNA